MIMMECGHIVNSVSVINGEKKPYCIICGCSTVKNNKPVLTNRKAKCIWCGQIRESNETLPFFEYKQNSDFDSYYCGCGGWD